MSNPTSILADLQARLSQLLQSSPANDLERNLRALLAQGFQKMDLATREELEVQRQLLMRAEERIRSMEQRLQVLESKQ